MFKQLEGLSQAISAVKKSEVEFQLLSKAEFEDGTPFEIYLIKDANNNYILTDKKRTLKYMSNFYELSAQDVKNSINNVLKIYGFSMYQGSIVCKLNPEDNLFEKYFQFVVCVGQLANMFAFFDEPKLN